MCRTHIRVDSSTAEQQLGAQIEKGVELAKAGGKALQEAGYSRDGRTFAQDNFKVLYEQWQDFTIQALREVFVSDSYAQAFREMRSSKKKWVTSDWVPDIPYYLEHLLLPKINYLAILRNTISQFQHVRATASSAEDLATTCSDGQRIGCLRRAFRALVRIFTSGSLWEKVIAGVIVFLIVTVILGPLLLWGVPWLRGSRPSASRGASVDLASQPDGGRGYSGDDQQLSKGDVGEGP